MKKVPKLVKYNENGKLKEMNQYNVQNAWFDINFGGYKYGIFSAACQVEVLHALGNGLITYCLEILFSETVLMPQGLFTKFVDYTSTYNSMVIF